MQRFTARACFVGDHHAEGCFMVVLAEQDADDDSDGERLVLQLVDGRDAEDRRQGLDVYSVRTRGARRHHNGVAAWAIAGTVLTLRLKHKACLVLEVEEGFEIELLPVSSQLQQIADAVGRIVDGSGA